MVQKGEIIALNATYNCDGGKLVKAETIDGIEILSVQVSDISLPKSVLFETEDKVKVEILVQVVEEGEIFALNPPYKDRRLVKTETIEKKGHWVLILITIRFIGCCLQLMCSLGLMNVTLGKNPCQF